MTPFQTDDLVQAAFVWCQGYEPTRTMRTGNFITFIFGTLDAHEAARMLGGAEHSLCKRYSHAWRGLRKMADEARRNDGGRR